MEKSYIDKKIKKIQKKIEKYKEREIENNARYMVLKLKSSNNTYQLLIILDIKIFNS